MRHQELDIIRGVAVLLMVLFHLLWDLRYFEFITLPLYSGPVGLLVTVTASLFLLVSGVSMSIAAHRPNFKTKHLNRSLYLLGVAILLSMITSILFPGNGIYFGILHLLSISAILSIPIAKKPIVLLTFALLILSIPLFIQPTGPPSQVLSILTLAPPTPTLDYYPLVPWAGIFLFGIFIGPFFFKRPPKPHSNHPLAKFLSKTGIHALKLYLIHQLILFPVVWLLSFVL